MSDALHLRYSGPLPRPIRRAVEAAGAEAWRRRAADGQARALAALCRRVAAALAAERRDHPARRPGARLGLLSRRLAAARAQARRWRDAADGECPAAP